MKKQLPFVAVVLASLALACGVAAAGDVGTSKSYRGPTGLQLYSLRNMQKAQGVEATLDKAVALGFKYVEVADLGRFSPAEFKQQLDRRGLVPIGRHSPTRSSTTTWKAWPATPRPWASPTWAARGFRTRPVHPEQCHAAARVFNQAGAALAKHGIKFYYHNHGYEFEPYEKGPSSTCWRPRLIPKRSSSRWTCSGPCCPARTPSSCSRSTRAVGC